MNSTYLHQIPRNFSLVFLSNQTFPGPNLEWFIESQEIQRIITISYTLLLAVVSLLGNSSLLAIFIKYKDMRTTSNLFIINMVVSDLLYVTVVIPPVLQQVISRSLEWKIGGVLGSITCKLVYFIRDMTFTVSITSLVALALDRFYAVVYPMKRKPRCFRPRFSIPLIWFISVAPFAIYFYTYRLVSIPVYKDTYCVPIWDPPFDQVTSPRRQYVFVVVAFFIVPLVFITVFYSIIIYKLRNRNIPGERTSETEKIRRKRNKNITKVGVSIVLCFFFSWAPYHFLNLILEFHWNNTPPLHLSKLIYWLGFIFLKISMTSIASNACVLYACSSKFRSCLKKMLISCCCPSRYLSDRSDSVLATQSFRLQSNKIKIEGEINNGMWTGQTIKMESGWETKF